MSSALEDIKTIDLDQWLTLATAPSPTKLLPGQTPYAYNTWVDEKPGSVITANGYIKVGTTPSGNPGTFSINYFNTSAGTQTYVVSDNSTVWATVDFQNFTTIITGLTSTFQLRGAVIRDKLWLTNGNDYVRTFDGTNVIILNGASPNNLTIQGLTYALQSSSEVSPSQTSIQYIGGGTAGSEVVTVTGSIIIVQIQSGVSTANQVFTAISASSVATALLSVSIVSGSTIQTIQGSTFFSGGTPLAPKGAYIAYHDERVWLYQQPSARSLASFSALSDAVANEINPDDWSAWQSDNNLQISEGDADFGTGMILYRGYLHFFKQYSIWRLVGYDEYSYSRWKTRASTGTRFNESLQVMDSLVHFIGIDGIYIFDGEETERISDIIDPSTAEQASFGFNQLQQPNTNNQFWEVTATADWNAGNVPANLAISNAATLQAADNTQADFQAGTAQTNIDTTTTINSIQVTVSGAGVSSTNLALNQVPTSILEAGLLVGNVGFLTNGENINQFGIGPVNSVASIVIPLALPNIFTQIILKNVFAAENIISSFIPSLGAVITSVSSNATIIGGTGPGIQFSDINGQDIIIGLLATTLTPLQFFMNGSWTMAEIQVFSAAYNTSAQFISRTLDLGDTPASNGNFFADVVLNTGNIIFFTETSADGVTWDAAVDVTNGGVIGSVPRRYIRWGGQFFTDGTTTPILSDAWIGTLYESVIHNTGGNIFSWGAFAADYQLFGQSIAFYYRGASTSAGVLVAPWNLIVPGGAVNLPVTDQYIQFKFEISGYGGNNNPPVISSVTINWATGIAGQPQVLQNVASFFWRNRYWLSAAQVGATANNIILIRGKKTFNSPWQLKDWPILSFTRYLDNLIATSSVDGSIYQLDTGYSANGTAFDSIFETGDFSFKGFQVMVLEIMLETERLGPYTLFVGTSTDQGQTWIDTAIDLTLPTGAPPTMWKKINNLNITTDKIRLRFYTNQVDQPWQVHTCVVYYKPSLQRGTVGVN
jgi:hypothetical protein